MRQMPPAPATVDPVTFTRPPVSRYRDPSPNDPPRSWFARPKHLTERNGPEHAGHAQAHRSGRHLASLVVLAVAVLAIAVGVRVFAIQLFYIPSASMEPTLCGGDCQHGNDSILVNKLAYALGSPQRGDVVVFARPHALDGLTTDKDLVKRVVGVGGDQVRWSGRDVWVNDKLERVTFVDPVCANNTGVIAAGSVTVPKNDIFVMGDNRCNSEDSRVFGPISVDGLVGKAFLVVWPLQRVRTL